jgi:aryl-alcohol dehydrogenase-like predicted oxidoreductase
METLTPGRARPDLVKFRLGIGTYLGRDDDATDALYADAIGRALELGVNVIDSAINYRHQRSERAIGGVLKNFARENILVATKGGFLARGAGPAPGTVRPDEIVANCHCMAPAHLRDQIERSRRNLGVATIDIYYVHNPETQLEELPRDEFLRRMRAAFETLEAAVAEGKIGVYGTATWSGYREPGELSLPELLAIAREVGGADHHFRAIQLPYNQAMPQARAFIAAAADAGMTIMTSASIMQGKLPDPAAALRFVLGTPGVAVALVGAKTRAHVEVNVRAAQG